MKPTKGSVWLRISGNHAGRYHRVVESSPDYVCTWSEPSKDEAEGGFSWLGPLEMFLHEFREVKS
jgi:hypothetical protein